jgi:putative ABC transport system permease protein
MAWWSRFARTFGRDRLAKEFDEELESHLEEAVAQGRDPIEARRALGGASQQREASLDVRTLPRLEAVLADGRFGWRQIRKNPITSAAAVLSLGLAMGACLAAFRIVDAVLLRPLPIAHPERLFLLVRHGVDAHGTPTEDDSCEYPVFVRMRDRVRDRADLLAISHASEVDVFYGSEADAEKAYRQFVSGSMFAAFGLQPAGGRLLSDQDDASPGASPYAVVSYDYWTRRFGRQSDTIGRTLRIGTTTFTIVGIAPPGFTGTEPGLSPDLFVPVSMNPMVRQEDSSWFRAFVRVHDGVTIDRVLAPLRVEFQSTQEMRAKGFVGLSPEYLRAFLDRTLVADRAATGVSGLQRTYAGALAVIAVFVGFVLLIACANIAALKLAQTSARSREMALRVSIGAGRGRLIQLLLIESALIALASAAIGVAIAWESAPVVVSRLNPASSRIWLDLPIDWRVTTFGIALTMAVALLFGIWPAVRAGATSPLGSLKGHGAPVGSRMTYLPTAVQVAFCAFVLLIGGLLVATLDRLSHLPTGFTADRLVNLEAVAQPGQLPMLWDQVAADLRALPGVESAAIAGWPLLSGNGSNGFIWVNGAPTTDTLAYFLGVSPGWTKAMGIPFVDGRDFRDDDRSPGVAIVNEAFAKEFFRGRTAVGQSFERQLGSATRPRYQIIGVVKDARYRNLREPITPTAYIPFSALDATGALRQMASATFVVRGVRDDVGALVPALRRVVQARSGFRVSAVETQRDIDDGLTVRERLLAMLAWFFSIVALALTAIGVYGVLHYSVQRRQREIGICRAIGAPSADIAWRITSRIAVVLASGAVVGIALGLVAVRSLTALLFGVQPTDPQQLAIPLVAIVGSAVLAATPPVLRAIRVNPTVVLRAD